MTWYFLSRLIFKVLLKFYGRFEVVGSANVPKKGPFIMASNHVSYADPAVVGVISRKVPVRFIAKRELFESPRFGWWFRAMRCIPAERESGNFAPLKAAIKILQSGEAVGIFPEGTRSTDGTFRDPEPGIGFLASKSGVPIVPIYINGTEKALPHGEVRIHFCKIKAFVGKPIKVNKVSSPVKRRENYEDIGKNIMKAIVELKEKGGMIGNG